MRKAFRPIALLRRFAHETRGSVIALSALLLPILGGASLFGIDHMRASQQIGAMQKAADAAALASVRQMGFVRIAAEGDTGAQNQALTAIAEGLVRSTLDDRLPHTETMAELLDDGLVRVSLTARYGSLFGEMGAFGDNPFTVTSFAQTFGGQDVCFIALGVKGDESSIEMKDQARLSGEACEIYSGSGDPKSIVVENGAKMSASFICSGGGAKGNEKSYSPQAATDCAQIDDPLSDFAPPPEASAAHSCDHDDVTYTLGTHTMRPGIYCGKTDLKSGARVTMDPGVYVFRDGELHLHDDAVLKGDAVGLYFDDKKSYFKFMDEGTVDLTASTGGSMPGMLIAARPVCDDGGAIIQVSITLGGGGKKEMRCKSGRQFSITSSNVRKLLGTIHLPHDTLTIETDMPVSQEAAFTIVVVGQIILEDSPTLVLNSDYASTNVPVPQGFRDSGQTTSRLTR